MHQNWCSCDSTAQRALHAPHRVLASSLLSRASAPPPAPGLMGPRALSLLPLAPGSSCTLLASPQDTGREYVVPGLYSGKYWLCARGDNGAPSERRATAHGSPPPPPSAAPRGQAAPRARRESLILISPSTPRCSPPATLDFRRSLTRLQMARNGLDGQTHTNTNPNLLCDLLNNLPRCRAPASLLLLLLQPLPLLPHAPQLRLHCCQRGGASGCRAGWRAGLHP